MEAVQPTSPSMPPMALNLLHRLETKDLPPESQTHGTADAPYQCADRMVPTTIEAGW